MKYITWLVGMLTRKTPVKFEKFLRTPILKNIWEQLLVERKETKKILNLTVILLCCWFSSSSEVYPIFLVIAFSFILPKLSKVFFNPGKPEGNSIQFDYRLHINWYKLIQETLHVVTMAMICSTLASLWKF